MQRGFIAGLARGLNVEEAARSVGMRRQGAYALRTRPGAESFAAAWDSAQRHARSGRTASFGAPAAALRGHDVAVVRFRGPIPPDLSTASPPKETADDPFSALLDRICPAPRREVREADKADKADEKSLKP